MTEDDFNVWDIIGKKIVGIYKDGTDHVKLQLEDGSVMVFLARSGYQGGLFIDYMEAL